MKDVPLGSTVAFAASICLYYIPGNCGHARSQGGCETTRHQTKIYSVYLKKTGILYD